MNEDQKVLGILAHVLGFITGFLGPLIMYLAIDKKSKFAREHSKEALNFQITLIIAYVVSFILVFIFIGVLFLIATSIVNVVFCIMGAVAAGNNKKYKYPITINFIQ